MVEDSFSIFICILVKLSKVTCSSSHRASSSLSYSRFVFSPFSTEAGLLLSNSTFSLLNKLTFKLAILLAVVKPASLRLSHFRIKLCQSAALSLIFLALTDKTGFLGVAIPRFFEPSTELSVIRHRPGRY